MIKVTVPATTANLGPGFDCLGLALSLYNEVTFSVVSEPGLTITISGEGADILPVDESNLVYRAATAVFTRCQQHPPGLYIQQQNHIPVGSGLGSSSAATLAGILGANALLGNPLAPEELLQMASHLEGHPDNVAPAMYGSLTLSFFTDNVLSVENILIPPQQLVIVLPEFHLSTTAARSVLPATVSFVDAIFNISRASLVLRALEQKDYVKLGIAMADRLHQPYRLPLIPGAAGAFAAALTAGATAVALSGAGPSIAAFTIHHHERIAMAIKRAFREAGLNSRHWVLPVDINGSQVITLNNHS